MATRNLKKDFPRLHGSLNLETDEVGFKYMEELAKYDIVSLSSESIDLGNKDPEEGPVKRIKAADPNTIVLCYLNVIDRSQGKDLYEIRTKHPDWLLRDKQGNPCRAYNLTEKYRSGTRWMMDPRSDWKKFYARRALEITYAGYDGIFADNTWDEYNYEKPLHLRYSRLELDMTVEEWQDAWAGFLGYVKKQIGDKLLIGNAPPVRQYLENSDGDMLESFMQLDIRDFHEQLEKAKLITEMGKILMNHSYYANELITKTNLFRWYYTCSLLTDGYFCYMTGFDPWHPEYKIKLGEAKGKYYQKDGIYQRDFESGKVLVNPTLKDFYIKLEDEFRLWGREKVKEIKLTSYSGALLETL